MATSDEAVVVAIERLRTSPLRKPDIAALVEELCISRPALETRFKAVMGRSIRDESVRLRVAAIRKLITQTDLPLKTIAARAGFRSVQYMTTYLHRHTGTTPARLRIVERRLTESSPPLREAELPGTTHSS